MTPQAFLDLMVPAAQACHARTGIPASFTLAQAALESSWGSRAPGFNLFGIKADKAWRGPVVMVDTHEVLKGVRVAITAPFRAYRSFEESMVDHADFFKRNPRYKACFAETTGSGWARAVAAAGYATDPNYAKSLIAVIDGRNMTRFDAPKGKV